MSNITVNCETGEIDESPLTDSQIQFYINAENEAEELRIRKIENDSSVLAAAEAEAAAKASASAKLAALGLTEEEVAALIK
jgi:hypothetical protein